jgi:DNA-binding transcriptional ArsR family regulator
MKTLSDDTLDQVALFLKSLAEPTRLKILRFLHDEEKTVTEIMEAIDANQSNVSRHLTNLTTRKIVSSRREGTSIYYKITDPNIVQICDTVCRSIAAQISQSRSTLKNIKRGVEL